LRAPASLPKLSRSLTTLLKARTRLGLALLAALVCCFCLRARGESFQVRSWHVDEGLPDGTVTALAQTPDGYLWVGTRGGLARFDGVRFTTFTAQNTPELGRGRIPALFTDAVGACWIATADGALVRMKNGGFTSFRLPGEPGSLQTMAAAQDGTIWFATARGTVGRLSEGAFLSTPTNLLSLEGPLRIHAGYGGAVRVSGAKEMVLCAGQDGMPERVAFGTDVAPLAPSRAGGWWFAGSEGVRLWRNGGWAAAIPLASNAVGNVQAALEDSRGQLWLGTAQDGLLCCTTNAPVRQFTTADGLGSDAVLCLSEDARGALWVGTERGGLSRLRRTPFRSIGRKQGLSSEFVTSVCAGAEGEVWVGTDGGGLNLLKASAIKTYMPTNGLAASRVDAVCLDAAQSLWVAARGGRLFVGEAGEFKDRSALVSGASQISALFEDARWQLWLGATTPNELVRIVGEAPRRFGVPSAAPTLDLRVFAEDATGALWIGTEGSGLLRWDGRDFRRFTRANGLSADTIWSLWADARENVLWIGTSGGGLSCLDRDRLNTCTTRHGLHDDVICHIQDDGRGWLWFGSHKGIFRVANTELREFFAGQRTGIHSVAFGLSDGLPTLECAGGVQPAGCRTRDGRLWFPTAKGLVVVDPADVDPDREPPRVLIEELLVDDVARRPASGQAAELLIEPGSHRFLFRFTGLGTEAPEWVRFRCQLEGSDPDWIDLGTQRSAQYSGLRPGLFRFRVTAKNRDGVWNEAGAVLAFRVRPYLWQAWWFQGTVALALAGSGAMLVIWIVRRRHRARIERLERLHAVERERARIAQDIHDDLGASLTQIALLSELAQSQLEEPQAARRHLDLIFTSARNLARATDEIVWALHPKNNAVEPSLNFLTRFAQEYLRAAGLPCRLDIPAELPEASLPSATRHHLYLALKEALNNVVKHAAATEVWIRLTCEGNSLVLTVEDNGRGFDRSAVESATKSDSAARHGNGLQSMEHRMRALGGVFEQTTQVGHGTVTRFSVPLQK
jgi:signal transduction histidine kinase/ligand-binding sensor domain-containing protein